MDEFFALFDDVDPNEAESKADKPVTASRSSRLNANARTAEEEAYRAARHNKTDDAASAGAEISKATASADEPASADAKAGAASDTESSASAGAAAAGAGAGAAAGSAVMNATSRSNAENNTEFYYGTASRANTDTATRRRNKGAAGKSGVSKVAGKGKQGAAAAASAITARTRKYRKPPRKLSPGKSILSFLLIFCMMAVFAVGIVVGIVFLKAPNIETDNIYSQIKQRSIVYDADGNEIDALYFDGGNRTIVEEHGQCHCFH